MVGHLAAPTVVNCTMASLLTVRLGILPRSARLISQTYCPPRMVGILLTSAIGQTVAKRDTAATIWSDSDIPAPQRLTATMPKAATAAIVRIATTRQRLRQIPQSELLSCLLFGAISRWVLARQGQTLTMRTAGDSLRVCVTRRGSSMGRWDDVGIIDDA